MFKQTLGVRVHNDYHVDAFHLCIGVGLGAIKMMSTQTL